MFRTLICTLVLTFSFSALAQTLVLIEPDNQPMRVVGRGEKPHLVNFEEFRGPGIQNRTMVSVVKILKKKDVRLLPDVMEASDHALDGRLTDESATQTIIGAIVGGNGYSIPSFSFRLWSSGVSFECGAKIIFKTNSMTHIKEAKIVCPNEVRQAMGMNPVIEVKAEENIQVM